MTPAEEQLRSQLDAANREIAEHTEALKQFARDIIQRMWDGGVSGFDVQDIAVEHGLIIEGIATEEDCDGEVDFGPGDSFFRFAPWLNEREGEGK